MNKDLPSEKPPTLDDKLNTEERARNNFAWHKNPEGGVRGLYISAEKVKEVHRSRHMHSLYQQVRDKVYKYIIDGGDPQIIALAIDATHINPTPGVGHIAGELIDISQIPELVGQIDKLLPLNAEDDDNIEEKEIETTSDNFIPTSEILKKECLGFLFLSGESLKYLSLEDKLVYTLTEFSEYGSKPTIMFANDIDIYVNSDKKIKGLFNKTETKGWVFNKDLRTMLVYDGIILNAGSYGLYDASNHRILISEDTIRKRKIIVIQSLCISPDGGLYGLVHYEDHSKGLIRIRKKNSKVYKLSDEVTNYPAVYEYDTSFSSSSSSSPKSRLKTYTNPKAEIIPYGCLVGKDGKTYNFSVIRNFGESNGLYLNNEMIQGTATKNIENFEVLSINGKEAVVLCSVSKSFNFSQYGCRETTKLKIDLEKRIVLKKERVWINMGDNEYTKGVLAPIYSKELHNRIREEYKEVVDELKEPSFYEKRLISPLKCVFEIVVPRAVLFGILAGIVYLADKGCDIGCNALKKLSE